MTHWQPTASPWIQRWTHLLPPARRVLDVACGAGRHLHWFHTLGHSVTGIDRDLEPARAAQAPGLLIEADIENGPWPLAGQQFGAVVVTNYLWRPLFPQLLQSLQPGGLLLYETFAAGNETVGRPSRPDYLLQPGELLKVCAGLQVIAYENGFLESPDRFVQRIAAIALPPGNIGTRPERYPL